MLKREKTRDFYLLTTELENIFISELMVSAPGDFVKVYVYALMAAKAFPEITDEKLAAELGMSVETVKNAWKYWEEKSVVKIEDGEVTFAALRDQMYGIVTEEEAPKPAEKAAPTFFEGESLKVLFEYCEEKIERPLNTMELTEIASWINDLGATYEVVKCATAYCVERGKGNIKYIAKVVSQWTNDGIKTVEDAKARLNFVDERQKAYKRILSSLGFNRNATDAERELMDKWFDEMKYKIERILDACAKTISISNPNLRYVNKILESWAEEAKATGRDVNNRLTVTQAEVKQFYEYLRNRAENEAEQRKQEVYAKLPRVKEIDQEAANLGRKLIGLSLGGNLEEVLGIRRSMQSLTDERVKVLEAGGFEGDYTEARYLCKKCKDTGIDENGQRCSCNATRMGEAELWQKEQKLR